MKTASVVLILLLFLMPTAFAQYSDSQLIEMFAPTLKFNTNELFYVAPVSYHIDNSNLMQYSGVPSLIDSNPSLSSISSYTEAGNYYLDNRIGWFDQIAADYGGQMQSLTPTIYAHVYREGQYTSIQYWFFYPFNNGPLNEHEGDWEMILVLLNQGTPESAIYSQHNTASKLAWGEVDKIADTHPVVYIARGSHANYFRPYEGRFGLQNDDVGGGGATLTPASAGGNMRVVSLDDGQSTWLNFAGRWGDWGGLTAGVRGARGPHGPSQGDHSNVWNSPVSWAISIPATGGTMFLFNWLVYNFLLLFLIYLLVRSGWKCFGIYRLAKGPGLQVGSILKSSFTVWLILGIVGTIIVFIGIMTPWYTVAGDIQSAEIQTGGMVDIITFNGVDGLRINTLERDQGMTSLFNFSLPFGFILLAGVIFTILDIIGIKSGRGLGFKYLLGGIMPIMFFLIVLIGISSLTALLPNIAPMLGQEGVPAETATLIGNIASSPLSGGYQGPMGGYANLNISWGLGIGAYLLLLGGLLRIFAGIAMIASCPKSLAQQPVAQNTQVVVQYAPSVQQPQIVQPKKTHKSGAFCQQCGAKTERDGAFCHSCGAKLMS
jgi:hypothetical protein